MKIWVDADACPKVIKEILYRASKRVQVPLTLVANRQLKPPHSNLIDTIIVPDGMDVADNRIIREMKAGDLVITADIPLAAEVIENEGYALNPRGEFYTRENVRHRLSIRNFMDDLRSSGIDTGGPKAFSQKDRQNFANALDKFLLRTLP